MFAWLDRQKLLHCLPCWYVRHELQSALQVYEWGQVSSQRWSLPLSARMDRCTVYRKWVPPGSNAGLYLQFIGICIHCSVFFHCSILLIPCSASVHIMLRAQSLLMHLCFGKEVNRIFSGQCHVLGCSNFNSDTCISVCYIAVTRSTAPLPEQVEGSFLESIVIVVGSATRRRRRSFLVGLVWPCLLSMNSHTILCSVQCWRVKDQLDVTCHFISLVMCSTCFGH